MSTLLIIISVYAVLVTLFLAKKQCQEVVVEKEVPAEVPEGMVLISHQQVLDLIYAAYDQGKQGHQFVIDGNRAIFGPVGRGYLRGEAFLYLKTLRFSYPRNHKRGLYPVEQNRSEKVVPLPPEPPDYVPEWAN